MFNLFLFLAKRKKFLSSGKKEYNFIQFSKKEKLFILMETGIIHCNIMQNTTIIIQNMNNNCWEFLGKVECYYLLKCSSI